MMMFSGLVSRISTRSLGSCTGIDVVTTGIVIRKMISSTNITSTRGVVLMAEMTSSSDAGPTAIAMVALLKDRKSTRLNSSHSQISYAVFCLKKKKKEKQNTTTQTT